MDIKSQVIEAVLRNYGKSDKDLLSSIKKVSEEEILNVLETLNLKEFNQRNIFFWELQAEVEKQIYENIVIDDSERVSEIISESWNQAKGIKVNSSVVLSFLYVLNFKFPNSRKAFASVCDGDLQSYKAFNNNSRVFIDLLVRYLICKCHPKKFASVRTMLEAIMPRFFENWKVAENQDSFERLGFAFRKNKNLMSFPQMGKYKRNMRLDNLVFAEGIKSILLDSLKEEEETEALIELKRLLETPNSREVKTDDYEVDNLIENNSPNSLTPKELEKNEDITNAVEDKDEFMGYKDSSAETVGIENTAKEIGCEITPRDEILTSLEQAFGSLQHAITQITLLDNEKKTSVIENMNSTHRLAIAEEEVNRLQIALNQEREKVAQAEEKAYRTVLQAIGGESSNYLLSDLFEESQGKIPDNPNISSGRLVNLFSSLSLAIGLEEFNGGHNLGELFKIQKDELIKNYRIDGPIESPNKEILVKLLKYGWTMNGIVIVQPLVTQVKEEN
ncbi:hypothetical protein [Sutcliffiella deserti]|uniref:hypothetical protein n=1 Tax=Sutcliffiella deserti TaxID=2875501 RepID=UPI001CC00AF5|nr:hypothetical protein [Sutcliffiella deserti]